jgi:ABC-type glutathione transport system ATPase component
MDNMVEVRDLKKYFRAGGSARTRNVVKAVDGISFRIPRGTTLGLVGESGSGKTTVARTVAGLIRPDGGSISVNGDLDMVFQDPYSSLNPRMTVADIIGESLYIRGYGRKKTGGRVEEMLHLVGLPLSGMENSYPHQFSGGERQRIAIARSLIRYPELLILDEPVSSLDVSVQAGILNLLKDLQDRLGLTYLLISHDLRIIEFMSDRVAVMRRGRIVEQADPERIYRSPRDEYTRSLLRTIPVI